VAVIGALQYLDSCHFNTLLLTIESAFNTTAIREDGATNDEDVIVFAHAPKKSRSVKL